MCFSPFQPKLCQPRQKLTFLQVKLLYLIYRNHSLHKQTYFAKKIDDAYFA